MHGAVPTMASAFANAALLISFLIPPKLFAQDTPLTQPALNSPPTAMSIAHETIPMPKDPAAILNVAAKVNGLGGPGLRPWHVRVSYQTFDTNGHSQDFGTYEEFWISDKKYKRSYTGGNFTQTDFATDRGLYRSGNQNWPGFFEIMVRTELIEPIPVAMSLRDLELGNNHRSFGKVKLQCVTLKSKTIFPKKDGYCFQQDQPVLRFASSKGGRNDTLYNDVVVFQEHFLARDIRLMAMGKPHLTLHIEDIEVLSTINESDFALPPDAVPVLGGKVTISEETMKSLCLRTVAPHYPENARTSHIEGPVVMQITVGKDGHVTNAQAVSGPDALRKAAIDSIRKWEFRPFLILGEPNEVESKFEIIFSLSN